MKVFDATAADHSLVALRERKRLFDDVWLLTLFVIFVAIAIPWFLRILDLDLGPLAWSLFGFGLAYMAGVIATDRIESHQHLLLVIGTVHALGMLFLGYLWHLVGGLRNPMFLLVFGLPVVAGSLVLLSWRSYVTVLMAVSVVVLVALIEAPELRWYLVQIGVPAEWLIRHLPESSSGVAQHPGAVNAGASYFFVVLELFAVFLVALALMAESFTALLRRLYGRLGASATALDDALGCSREMMRASPVPAALVYADTCKIAEASDRLMDHLALTADALLDGTLFDHIRFSYPDVVEALIFGTGGEIPLAVYRQGNETRMARVRVASIHRRGIRYAYVTIEDISHPHYLQAAFDAGAGAQVVVGADGQIVCFNQAAGRLFEDMHIGMSAALAFNQPHLPERWWELGLKSRLARRVELGNKPYQVDGVAVEIPGERDPLNLLTLRATQGGA